ncbi:unnamed protein product [Closterium sp. Naga37s-1]|nr:unnamed protein product [Closterium sp. Naga37s-1]
MSKHERRKPACRWRCEYSTDGVGGFWRVDKLLKEKMLKERFGDWKTSFRYIPRVLERFKEIDPDSTLDLVTKDHAFFRAFVAPSASRTALRFCRPVIGMDGTFLIRAQRATLLVAAAKDGNNQLVPLAYGLCESENKDSWMWFCANLLKHFPSWPDTQDASLISDRDKGLIPAVKEVFPSQFPHYFCSWHLEQNVLKFGPNASELFKKLANCRTKRKFGKLVRRCRAECAGMANYLFGVEETSAQQTRGGRGANQRAREPGAGDGFGSRTGAARRARMARMEVRQQMRSGRRGQQQAPSQQAPSQQAPSQQTPSEQRPFQQPPSQQTPSNQRRVHQHSTQQQPSQQPSSQQQPSQQQPSQTPHMDHGFGPMPTANLTRDRPSDMQPQSTAADNVHPLERVTATTSEHPSLAGENARDRATTISDSEAEADTTEEVFKEHFDVEDGSQISCGEEPGPDEDEERADMGHGSQSTNTATHPLSTTTAQQAAMRRQRRMEIIRGRRNAREAGARGRERAGTPVARLPTQGSQSARQPTPQQGVTTDMGRANDAAEATDVNHTVETGLGGLGNADAERVDSDTMEEGAAIIVRTGQDGPRNKRRKKNTVFIKQWARCYAPTCRFGIYSSQMVESINNAIKKIRILPVLEDEQLEKDVLGAHSVFVYRHGHCGDQAR